MCQKKIISIKPTNTKNGVKLVAEASSSKFLSWDDKFKIKSECIKHKEEHMNEIEILDISTTTNGNTIYECNRCNFESWHEDSIQEHLIDRLNNTKKAKSWRKKVYPMNTWRMEIRWEMILIWIVKRIWKQTIKTNIKLRQWFLYKY